MTLTVRWLRHESRRDGKASGAKHFYTASTAALFLTILANPVAGFLGYVGSQAIEYFIIVHRNVGPKYASAEADGRAPVGYAIRRLGRAGFFAAYIGIIFGDFSVLDRYGSPTLYTVVILTLGGMHVFYDGFIWKRPAVDRGGMLDRHSNRPPVRRRRAGHHVNHCMWGCAVTTSLPTFDLTPTKSKRSHRDPSQKVEP